MPYFSCCTEHSTTLPFCSIVLKIFLRLSTPGAVTPGQSLREEGKEPGLRPAPRLPLARLARRQPERRRPNGPTLSFLRSGRISKYLIYPFRIVLNVRRHQTCEVQDWRQGSEGGLFFAGLPGFNGFGGKFTLIRTRPMKSVVCSITITRGPPNREGVCTSAERPPASRLTPSKMIRLVARSLGSRKSPTSLFTCSLTRNSSPWETNI